MMNSLRMITVAVWALATVVCVLVLIDRRAFGEQVNASTKYWKHRVLDLDGIPEVEFRALYWEVVEIGPDAVPVLLSVWERKGPGPLGQKRLAEILGGIGPEAKSAVRMLRNLLGASSPETRAAAAAALGKIGPEAKMATDALVRVISDTNVRARIDAVIALGAMGADARSAMPTLVKTLEDDAGNPWSIDGEEVVCHEAARAISRVGDDPVAVAGMLFDSLTRQWKCSLVVGVAVASLGPRAVPSALTAMNSENPSVRGAAAWTFTILESADSVPALTRALDDENYEVRSYAARALGNQGLRAKSAVPSLISFLHEEKPSVSHRSLALRRSLGGRSPNREEAIKTLGRIGAEAKEAIGPLTSIVQLGEGFGGNEAAMALLRIDPGNRVAFEHLHELVRDGHLGGYTDAVEVLGTSGPRARLVKPAFSRLLDSPDPYTQASGAFALRKIDPTNKPAMRLLIENLEKDVPGFYGARDAIVGLGPNASEAVPALIRRLHNEQYYAVSALVAIGRPAVPALVVELNHKKMAVRKHAALCLGEIGSDAEAAVPALISALGDRRLAVRVHAARALGQIASKAPQAVPALASLLEDKYVAARCSAAEALGRFGADARSAIPALEAAAEDDYKTVTEAVSDALTKLMASNVWLSH